MAASNDKKTRIEQASKAGEEFCKIFYETFDRRRHLAGNLFLEDASLIWNGRAVHGKEAIGKFYQKLPSSKSQLRSIDAQPILDEYSQNNTMINVTANGQITFSQNSQSMFTESFLLAVQGTVWKITSSNFRYHQPVPL